jgi:hypothetical protein
MELASQAPASLVPQAMVEIHGLRIGVMVPAGDMVHTPFCVSLAQMLMRTVAETNGGQVQVGVQFYGSSILPFSRNLLAMTAIETGMTHSLWIDSDMEFTDDILLLFAQHARTYPIVGINAMSRRPPFRCTAQTAHGVELETSPESTGVVKVFRMGMGIALIDTEVFKKIEMPWFSLKYLPEHKVFMGEDYWFCERAKEAGYDIMVDHDISKKVKHVGQFGYSPVLKHLTQTIAPSAREAVLAAGLVQEGE